MKKDENVPIPFDVENGIRKYDFRRSCQYLNYLGCKKYGSNFRLYREDKMILYKLMVYAIRDEEQCNKLGLDLAKGILLNGPVGCGKTSLMTLFKAFHYKEKQYMVKSSRDIAAEFHQDGFTVIQKYGKRKSNICLDDLGVEKSMKYFGNECNTIGEVLLQRYDLMISDNYLTHATTNLNADELQQLYGNRVRSRFRSMFNLIAFDKGAGDKRI